MPSTVQRSAGAWAVCLLATGVGCTLRPGEPYGVVSADLEVAYAKVASRDAGDGWEKLNTGFEVKVEAGDLTLEELVLRDVGDVALAFDPAHPPEGYSLCHGGHCHRDDGALVSYEEISAELEGGGGPREVLHLVPPAGALLLLPGGVAALECEGGCELPRAVVREVRATLVQTSFRVLLRDGRASPQLSGELPLEVTLVPPQAPDGGTPRGELSGALELRTDRHLPPDIRLSLQVAPTAAVFDGVDWAALEGPSGLALTDAARAQLLANLVEVPVTSTLERLPLR